MAGRPGGMGVPRSEKKVFSHRNKKCLKKLVLMSWVRGAGEDSGARTRARGRDAIVSLPRLPVQTPGA